jgi:signal peptidase I
MTDDFSLPPPLLAEAAPEAPRPKRRGLRHYLLEIVQTAIQAAVLYFAISALFGRFEIRQTSMEPNFHEGQRVVVSQLGSLLTPLWVKTAYASDGQHTTPFGPERGQVVVLYPGEDRTQEPLIKRVIAGPGDTVEMADGAVKVNGAALAEPYLNGLTTNCFSNCGPLTLGADEYFVMGDNRPNSRDSRSFGPVRGAQIIGRVILRYWPLEAFQFYP